MSRRVGTRKRPSQKAIPSWTGGRGAREINKPESVNSYSKEKERGNSVPKQGERKWKVHNGDEAT